MVTGFAERNGAEEGEDGKAGEAFFGIGRVEECGGGVSRAKAGADDFLVAAGVDGRDEDGLAHAADGGFVFARLQLDAREVVVGGEVQRVLGDDFAQEGCGFLVRAGPDEAGGEFFAEALDAAVFRERLAVEVGGAVGFSAEHEGIGGAGERVGVRGGELDGFLEEGGGFF